MCLLSGMAVCMHSNPDKNMSEFVQNLSGGPFSQWQTDGSFELFRGRTFSLLFISVFMV